MQPSGSKPPNFYLDGFQEAQLGQKEISETVQFTCTINQVKEKGIRNQNIKSAPWGWARQVPKSDTYKKLAVFKVNKLMQASLSFFTAFFCFGHIKVKYFHSC